MGPVTSQRHLLRARAGRTIVLALGAALLATSGRVPAQAMGFDAAPTALAPAMSSSPPPSNPAPAFSEVSTAGPTQISSSITADTVWSPTGSPYVVSGLVKVLDGAALTLLPGTVVKFSDYQSKLVVYGQLLALGTPADRVVFTSAKDDTVLGDTNGDGAASTPAAGDWGSIELRGSSDSGNSQRPLSVLDYADVRYGGYGTSVACQSQASVYYGGGHSRMVVSNSSITHSMINGISVQAVSDDGFVGIYNNTFATSGCGVSVIQSNSEGPTEIIGNTFESSFGRAAIFSLYPNQVRAWFNTVKAPTVVSGSTPTRAEFDLSYNSLLGGVGSYGTESQQMQDLRFNWWGDDLNSRPLPSGCQDSQAMSSYQPPVSTTGSGSCPTGMVIVTGWKRTVVPALSSPPKGLPESISRAQAPTYGPVDTYRGELTYATDDLTVQDAGRQITAARTYKSKAGGSDDLGAGWRSSFSEALSINADNVATLDLGDGGSVDFATDPAAGYVPAPGVTADYSSGPDGTSITGNDQTTMSFDAAGQLTAVLLGDPDHKIDIDRVDGKLTQLTGVSGRSISYERSVGKLDRIVDSSGRDATFTYADGLLASATGVDDKTEAYAYDSDDRLTKVTTPAGRTKLAVGYDADGRVSWVQEEGSGRADITYDTAHRTSTITLADETKIDQLYDADGRLLTETTRGGSTKHVVYDGFGRPVSAVTGIPQVAMTGYSAIAPATLYDFRGDPVRTIDPVGNTTSTWFNPKHKPLSTKYPDGNRLNRTYNDKGRITDLTDPRQGPWSFSYTDVGQVKTIVDPANRTRTFAYEQDGDLDTATDVTGAITDYANDVHGQVTAVTDPLGKTTTIGYTSWGQRKKVTLPRGGEYTTSFDDDRLIETLTDPTAGVTTYAYDTQGRLESTTDAALKTTHFEYDSVGRGISMTNARNATYSQEYTVEGRPKKVTDPDGIVTSTSYDPAGRPVRVTDAAGAVTQTVFDRVGNAIAKQTPDGASATSAFDAMNRISTHTSGIGGKWTYTYDPLGAVTKITDPAAKTKLFTYDAVGRLTKATDESNNATDLAYDDTARTTTVTDAAGPVRTVTYDAAGRISTDTNGRGADTTYTYDDDGNVSTKASPEGGVIAYHYDLAGRPTSVKDAALRTITAAYDTVGRLKLRSYADATTESYTYDAAGNPISFQDRNGKAWSATFTPGNRPSTSSDPLQHTTDIAYDEVGLQASVTDPTGVTTSYKYDAVGRVTSQANDAGAEWKTTYDGSGNPLTKTDPSGSATTFTYDALNRLKTEQVGTLAKATYTYDATGNLLTRVQSNQTRKWEYDARNRLDASIDARTNRTDYDYDLADNLTKRTSPEGRVDQWAFDLDDRLTKSTDPLGNATQYGYNAAGDLASIVMPRGGTFSLDYDNVGRLSSEKLPLQGERTYAYDGVGNRTAETLPSGTVRSYDYDDAGRHTATHAPGVDRTFGYDGAGRLTSANVSGYGLTFGYNTRGLLETSTSPGGTQTTQYDSAERISQQALSTGAVTNYGYDTNGNLKTVRGPSNYDLTYDLLDRVSSVKPVSPTAGGTDTYTYDADSRLTKVAGTYASVTNTYSPDGLLATSATDYSGVVNPEEGTATYERDLDGRPTKRTLTQGTTTVSTTTYGWDDDGNRTTLTDAAGTRSWAYDTADRLTAGPAGTTYDYDADGNLTTVAPGIGTPTTFTYNSLGEVSGTAAPGGSATLARDALGRVATRTTTSGTDAFEYDAFTNNPVSYDPATGAAVSLIRDTTGQLLAENPVGGAGRRALLNAHGDVFALKPQVNGYVTYSAVYDPFGTPTTTGANTAPLGFQAMVTEPLTGTVDMAFRAYDPSTARFTAADNVYPDMRTGVSVNRYAYGNANPLDYVDLNGHWSLKDATDWVVEHVLQPVVEGLTHVAESGSEKLSSLGRTVSNSSIGRSIGAGAANLASQASKALQSSISSLTSTVSNVVSSPQVQNVVAAAQGYTQTLTSSLSRLDTSSIHTALDIAGFVPVIGDAVDGINAGLYLLEGDTKNALIAFAAMVPVVGSSAVAAYKATKSVRMLDNLTDIRRGLDESGSAANRGPTTLFHYTDEAGQRGILESGSLNPSMKSVSPKDARYGDGQYLTDIAPGTKTCAQLSACFLGIPYQGRKFTHYVEIDVSGLNIVKGRDGVFVNRSGDPLDITRRLISAGMN